MSNGVIFYIAFLARFIYDIGYLYKDCLREGYNIVIYAFLHSVIFGAVVAGLFLNRKFFLISSLIVLGVFISQKIFNGCILTIKANEICKGKVKHDEYIPSSDVFLFVSRLVYGLYMIRLIKILTCYLRNKKIFYDY